MADGVCNCTSIRRNGIYGANQNGQGKVTGTLISVAGLIVNILVF